MFVRGFWFGMSYGKLQPDHISLQRKVNWSLDYSLGQIKGSSE